ncbi:unnamed protein product [Rotaria socialis]
MCIFIILARRIKNAWYINDYHRGATILHPKLKNFEFCRDAKKRSIDVLKQKYGKLELNNSLTQKIASNVLHNNNANPSQTSTTATTPKRKSLLTQCFDSKLTNQPQSSNSYQEIENYLNADYSKIPHNDDDLDDIDILSFWQESRHTFSQLEKLAKIICARPASNTILKENVPLPNAPDQGRKKASTPIDDRNLLRFCKKYRTKSSQILSSELILSNGKHLSARTEWNNIIWSDAAHFEVLNRKNRTCVRRLRSEADQRFNFVPNVQGGEGSISVWGCMAGGARGPLVIYSGKVDGRAYVKIIEELLPSFIENAFDSSNKNWMFMHDNAPPHRSKYVE